ncbi:hypothetical protein [Neorhizobium galegae]|nr:hypothetical protein [Neorhizobium galegae]
MSAGSYWLKHSYDRRWLAVWSWAIVISQGDGRWTWQPCRRKFE